MNINATLINLYNVCPRECWLHANGINMEHTSDTVFDGKLIHETSYQSRAKRNEEIRVSIEYKGLNLVGQLDFYDSKSKTIHETKRSDSVEDAHFRQVKFYIWLLELNGISGVKGILEYPKLRKTDEVYIDDFDRLYLEETVQAIAQLIKGEHCPPKIKSRICRSCSYFDFCYSSEID